jgi:hypothetical protein
MIATLFGKKRIAEEKLSTLFTNAVLTLVHDGFPMVAEELNHAPEFTRCPNIDPVEEGPFAMIVLAGNLMEAPRWLESGQDRRFASLAISKFCDAYGLRSSELELEVKALQQLMERVNQPSKNAVYAMSKTIFHKYDLFGYQSDYFRDLKAPNPIVLKRLNGLMAYFLWNWEEFMGEYRITG